MQYYPPNQSYPSDAVNYLPPPTDMGGPVPRYYPQEPTKYSEDQYYMGEPAECNTYQQAPPPIPNEYVKTQRPFSPHFKAPSVLYSSNQQDFGPRKRFPQPGNFQNRGNFQQRARPRFFSKPSRPRSEPSVQKQFTCDICKITCSTQPSLDTHFAGQKHKKKAAQQATMDELGEALEVPGVKTNFRCDFFCPVCHVTCTGIDTYKAHISGRLHLRAELMQKRNSIPITSPPEQIKPEEPEIVYEPPAKKTCPSPDSSAVSKASESFDIEDCIQEVKTGKSVAFHCKLCECTFTDPNSRGLHVKGKKHQQLVRRSQNPTLHTLLPSLAKNRQPGSKTNARTSKLAVQKPESFLLMPYSFGTLSSPFRSPLPHLYSNERYMQTKLRSIALSEAELSLMKTILQSCENALKKIILPLKPESGETEEPALTTEAVSAPKAPFSGVFRVGELASGLLITGDNEVKLVLVCENWPTLEYTLYVGTELERLVKAECPQFTVSISSRPEDGALLLHAMTENKENPDEESLPLSVLVRIQLTSVEVLKKSAKSLDEKLETSLAETAVDGQDEDEHLGEALPCNGVSKNHCIDALTDVRRALWLQSALYNHPLPGYIINVGRIFRSLMRESLPGEQWLPDFALLILLERLSFLDFVPTKYASGPSSISKMRPGIMLRRLLEILASGAILPGSQLFILEDPSVKNCEVLFSEAKLLPSTDLLVGMSTEQRETTTFTAQLSLRLIIFRQIYKVFNIPQFIPQYPDRKRKHDSTPETPAGGADTAANGDAEPSDEADKIAE